jgi:SAM-dependent methyltransferase
MTNDVPGRWTSVQFPTRGGTEAADHERFRELMKADAYPRASRYDPDWVQRNHMGPNVLWLTEALVEVLELRPGMRVLDMGCGTALSSIFLAREFGVRVWANDLWIWPTDNWRRIVEAGVEDLVTPIHAEAHALPYADGFFDAAISIDAYHYFGTDERYLPHYARVVRPGGTIAMVVPGNEQEVNQLPADIAALLGANSADFFTWRSPSWWAGLWGRSNVVDVELADMVPGGWALWKRHNDAGMAWAGTDTDRSGDAAIIESASGRSLGFTRIVARRRDDAQT